MSIKHLHQLSQRAMNQLKDSTTLVVREKIDGVPVELAFMDGEWRLVCPYYSDTRKATESFSLAKWPKTTAQILSPRTSLRDIAFTMVAAMVDHTTLNPIECARYTFECLPFVQTNAIMYNMDRIGCFD